jgi:hypothetical protein
MRNVMSLQVHVAVNGIHEVSGSIPLGSTNQVCALPPLASLRNARLSNPRAIVR